MNKIKRPIEEIAEQLQAVMKRETSDIIAIGDLLLEAKETVDYGDWRAWLATNFGSSSKTADNYMSAARFAATCETISQLKLRPTALYLLGSTVLAPNDPTIKAILKVAETEWVNADRAREIAQSLVPPPESEDDDSEEDESREEEEKPLSDQEINDILDGPPPVLPAPVPPVPVVTAKFNEIVAAAVRLQTKPMSDFVGYGADYTPDQIRAVIAFFQAVLETITKQKAA